MVATTTPIISQVLETDTRKRKQTLERTKCGHLCRQLQMRLQYARLKVEHGWEKQSLNEVENLYFHHSHLRGPRQFQSNTVATVSQPEPTYAAQPQGSAAAVEAGGAAPGSRGVNPYMSLTVNSARSSATPSSGAAGQVLPPSSTPTPTPIIIATPPPPANSTLPAQSSLPSPQSPQRRQRTPQSILQSPVILVSSARHPQYSYSVFPSGAAQRPPVTTIHQPQAAPSTITPPSASPNAPAQIAQSHGATPSSTVTTTAPSTTPTATTATSHYYKQEPFNFGSVPTSGLTYEGFWSNHLSSSPRTNHLRQTGYPMLSTPAAAPTAGPSTLGQQAPA